MILSLYVSLENIDARVLEASRDLTHPTARRVHRLQSHQNDCVGYGSEVRGVDAMSRKARANGASPQPDATRLGRRCRGAPAGRGETVTGKPGPVYEPSMRLVALNRPPE